jgi:hypothetical protein
MANDSTDADVAASWWKAFLATVQNHENAAPLKEAALQGALKDWTRLLTAMVVRSCEALNWRACAKGFPLETLPHCGQEYLGMDVMAFERTVCEPSRAWQLPVAVFELENSRNVDRVAYSLWKVICLRCSLRAVFAYQDDWDKARKLVGMLSAALASPISMRGASELPGQTVIVVGSRGEGQTFFWGYFKRWQLDVNLGRFERC